MSAVDLARPAPQACIHRRLALDPARLQAAQVAVARCDGATAPLIGVAQALKFPAYYGGNWDALEECLRDLHAWWPAHGWVLVVDGKHGDDWRTLDDCWRLAAAAHARDGRSFHLVYA